jgi:flagellin
MRIQNNVAALNAWGNLTRTGLNQQKALERLSSGYRINRAADDAAGLAISERMRAQINGINQAVRNAQDGISLVQTAEGAMSETHSILQRMHDLATQAANGTLTTEDRNKIQSEMDALATEVTRIATDTKFNGKQLLNGSLQAAAAGGGGEGKLTFQVGAEKGQEISVEIGALDAKSLGISRDLREISDNNDLLGTISLGAGSTLADGVYTIDVAAAASGNPGQWDITLKDSTGTAVATLTDQIAGDNVTLDDGAGATLDVTLGKTLTAGTATIEVKRAAGAQFNNGIKQSDATAIGGLDVTTEANAADAIAKIDIAINTISNQRSTFGSIQNRLEHTINNLMNVAENLTQSESRIRDVDMAKEMANLTKQQVLQQAGTAMLAQANQSAQAVLSLLR